MTRIESAAYRRDSIDHALLGWIPSDFPGVSVVDIIRQGFRTGTVRNAIARLQAAGLIKAKWDGNARYGRYLYTRVAK
jgi:hypothetical protein